MRWKVGPCPPLYHEPQGTCILTPYHKSPFFIARLSFVDLIKANHFQWGLLSLGSEISVFFTFNFRTRVKIAHNATVLFLMIALFLIACKTTNMFPWASSLNICFNNLMILLGNDVLIQSVVFPLMSLVVIFAAVIITYKNRTKNEKKRNVEKKKCKYANGHGMYTLSVQD